MTAVMTGKWNDFIHIPEKVAALLTAGSIQTNDLTYQNTTWGNSSVISCPWTQNTVVMTSICTMEEWRKAFFYFYMVGGCERGWMI